MTVLFIVAALAFAPHIHYPFHAPKLILLLLFLTLSGVTKNQRNRISRPWLLCLCAPVLFLHGLSDPLAWLETIIPLIVLILAWRVAPAVDTQAIQRGLAVSAPMAVLYVLAQKLGLDIFSYEHGASTGGFFGNPNFTAHFLLLCLCFGRLNHPWAQRLMQLICMAGAVLCQSRGALGAMGLWLLINTWRTHSAYGKPLAAGVLLLAMGLAPVFRHDLKTAVQYMSQPQTYAEEYSRQPALIAQRDPWFAGKRLSLMTRWILYGNSLHLLRDHPLAGSGAGGFHRAYPLYANRFAPDINMNHHYRVRHAHNLFLEGAIQLGIPWLLLFLLLLYHAFRQADPHWRLGAGLQLLVAMVSLNYLNPVILIVLILCHPYRSETKCVGRLGLSLGAFLLGVTILLGAIQWNDWAPGTHLRPHIAAAVYFEKGDYGNAWRFQVHAWRRDPYGPETLYNLAETALTRSKEPNDIYHTIAITALEQAAAMFPFYPAPADRLEQLNQLPVAAEWDTIEAHRRLDRLVGKAEARE